MTFLMQNFLYSALDLAAIINSMKLGCQAESRLIEQIWNGEKAFFAEKYREDKRKFILDIYYWTHYLHDKPTMDSELPAIQKDLADGKHDVDIEQYKSDCENLELFFKSVRIRVLYGNGNAYVRIKLRSLLAQYGYKRRSPALMQHIERCTLFYHLEAKLSGGVACDLATCSLDDMLTFRVV